MIAVGMGADVTVLDRDPDAMVALWQQFGAPLKTEFSTHDAIERQVTRADLVIGGVLIPGASAPKLVTRDMIRKMQPGSVIVDVAIDQGGCFETSRPTTHAEPTYVVDGVVHYCVANMPGGVPRTSTFALNNATLPFVLALADKGWRRALADDAHLRDGPQRRVRQGHVPAGRRRAGLRVRRPARRHAVTAADVTTASGTLAVAVWRGGRRRRASAGYDVPRLPGADGARRRHPHPAPARPDARLPLRLPRRHVRLVRDDGQRPRALDLPHARRRGRAAAARSRSRRSRNLPVIRDLVTDMRDVLRQVGAGEGRSSCRPRRARDDFARVAPASPARRAVDAGDRVHRLRRLLRVAATSSAGTRTTSAPRRSTARGRSSTIVRDGARSERLRGRRRRCRLPRLPHAPELHRALPEAARADGVDRGPEARDGAARRCAARSSDVRSLTPRATRRRCSGSRSARARPCSRSASSCTSRR